VSEGPLVFTGRLVELREGPEGQVGRVSVHGARIDVALAFVPEARPGDIVLVHAGVALSLVTDQADTVEWEGREG
jgi:hydrogenase expression/formation protein HypC